MTTSVGTEQPGGQTTPRPETVGTALPGAVGQQPAPAPDEAPVDAGGGAGGGAGEGGGPAPAREVVPPATDETDEVNLPAIVWTMVITIAAVTIANLVLLGVAVERQLAEPGAPPTAVGAIPWQPLVAIPLAIVSLTTFGGFYVAVRRARIAITASFLLTFLAMLPFALTVPELATSAETEFVSGLLDQFTTVVGTVVVFYFGSEAVISGGKLFATAKNKNATPADIRRADRDMATRIEPRQRG